MQEEEKKSKKLEKEEKKVEKAGLSVNKVEKKEDLLPKDSLIKKEEAPKDSLGDINIIPEVLATIVSRIVSNISGVAGLFAHSKSGIGTLLGVKEIEEGIRVDLTEGKSLSTFISVIVDYGSVIIDLAKKIQDVVKSEVEEKTGLLVKSVDVNIMGIQMPGIESKSKPGIQENK
jgi:uncharacterized alkaline shock family protein YloU